MRRRSQCCLSKVAIFVIPRKPSSIPRLRDAIETRFRAIFQLELTGDIGKSALAWIGAEVTQKQAADYIINAMNASLETAGLT
jgi:hypothetical protein